MSKPILKKSELISLIKEKGYSRKELADHYQISISEMNQIVKTFDIKLRAKKTTYELIDDVELEPTNGKNALYNAVVSIQKEETADNSLKS